VWTGIVQALTLQGLAPDIMFKISYFAIWMVYIKIPHILVEVLFFSRKEAKAFVLLRRRSLIILSPRSGATGSGAGPRKPFRLVVRSKGVCSASQKTSLYYFSAKRSHGVWGWPQKTFRLVVSTLLFQNRSKSVCSASQKTTLYPFSAKRSHGCLLLPIPEKEEYHETN
jgi:hypothetical protein